MVPHMPANPWEVSLDELIKRLQAQEDVLAILQLKYWLAECADEKCTDDHRKKPAREIERFARRQALCFTENAQLSVGSSALMEGREEIYEYSRGRPWAFTVHMYLNPQIAGDRTRATGKWILRLVASDDASGRPVQMCGTSTDTYRKVDGAWLISTMNVKFKFNVPFDDPWTPARRTSKNRTSRPRKE